MAGTALKGLIEAGTHRTMWTLSKPPNPATRDVPGEVELQGLRQPGGAVYGTAPVNWATNGPGRSRERGFLSTSITRLSTAR